MRVVVIGAHPDDAEIAMGGTIAKHVARGDEVHIVLVTLGGVSGNPSAREKEAETGAKVLGVDHFHSLDYSVSKLNSPKNHEFVRVIKKTMEELMPDRVYVHNPFDYHQVHVAISNSVVAAAPRSVKQLIHHEVVSSTTPDFKPNAFVDITSYMDTKLESVKAHKSQAHRIYMYPNVFVSMANFRYVWGKVGRDPHGFAEAFCLNRFTT